MKITILALGSRGDIEPYAALAAGFQDAGYAVRFASHPIYRGFIADSGIDFSAIDGADPRQEWAKLEESKRVTTVPLRIIRRATKRNEHSSTVTSAIAEACEGSDAVIFSLSTNAAFHVAEKFKIPCIAAYLNPTSPSAAFPCSTGYRHFGRWAEPLRMNRLTHKLVENAFGLGDLPAANHWRGKLGLKPIVAKGVAQYLRDSGIPFWFGFSPAILPCPDDWPKSHQVVGFWRKPAAGQPLAEELRAFLDAGEPPVFAGFGSTQDPQSKALLELVLEAISRVGCRAIIGAGWATYDTSALPKNVLAIQEAPFRELFPRVAAVVHHGGAGTTGAVATAGIPGLGVTYSGEQLFWAMRHYRTGAAARPIMRSKLTAANLASAIRQCLEDQIMRGTALSLARDIAGEDGIARCVSLFKAQFGSSGLKHPDAVGRSSGRD